MSILAKINRIPTENRTPRQNLVSDFFANKHCLRYVRNEQKQPIGVLLAFKDEDGVVKVGFSQLNPLDRFDKEFGIAKAIYRSKSVEEMKEHIHFIKYTYGDRSRITKILDSFTTFFPRVENYFNPKPPESV